MNDFYKTIKERKNLAQQAKHRKNGSKSKKCTLSTDYLTDKQIRERNGPVMVYNLGAPMQWDDFKKLPIEYQREYLSSLVRKYGVTSSMVGDMLGVSIATMSRLTNNPELGFKFKIGKRQTNEQRIEWRKFLNGDLDSEQQEERHEDDISEQLNSAPGCVDDCASKQSQMAMDRFTISFYGIIDIDMIANSLRQIVGSDTFGSIEISCRLNNV